MIDTPYESQSMHMHTKIRPCLESLDPPDQVWVLGANVLNGVWCKMLRDWDQRHVRLIEMDDTHFNASHFNSPLYADWQHEHAVVAAVPGAVTFYETNISLENGLIAPADLRVIWPNIESLKQIQCQAVSLQQLLHDVDDQAGHWVIVDSLSALPILQGAGEALKHIDVVVVRAVSIDPGHPQLTDLATLTDYLELQGYRHLATEAGRHPSIVHAAFVRDEAPDLRHAESPAAVHPLIPDVQVAALNEQLLTLDHALAAQTALAAEHLTQIERLTLVNVDATQRIAALTAERDAAYTTRDEQLELANQYKAQLELAAQKPEDTTVFEGLLQSTEQRLREDLKKGFVNTIRQIEAYVGIQNYFNNGVLLSDFHQWPVSPDIGLFLLNKIEAHAYDLIIEFGSGTSTVLFAKAILQGERGLAPKGSAKRIIAIEHNRHYYKKTAQLLLAKGLDDVVELIHAPLTDWQEGKQKFLHYEIDDLLDRVAKRLKDSVKRILVLVDGPPGDTCTQARYPAIPKIFNKLAMHRIDIVLDDANRKEEKDVIASWHKYWQKRAIPIEEEFVESEKGIYFASNAKIFE